MSEVKEQRELRLQQILDVLQRFKRQWQFLPESQEVVVFQLQFGAPWCAARRCNGIAIVVRMKQRAALR
jgi:hypothetical protein